MSRSTYYLLTPRQWDDLQDLAANSDRTANGKSKRQASRKALSKRAKAETQAEGRR
jgi:hypothetical protein